MNRINKWNNFIVESKKDWKKISKSKIQEFKDMIDDNSVTGSFDTNELLDEILKNLKSESPSEIVDIWYEEYIQFINRNGQNDYIIILLTKNGQIEVDDDRYQTAYQKYNRVTKWLDKRRDKEIIANYIIDFDIRSEQENLLDDHSLKLEVNNSIKILESLNFKITIWDKISFRAKIELSEVRDSTTKTLNLSGIVPDKIVDDFERFIIKKNLNRSDAEEIANIFSKLKE